jgi:hypothetical protein
MCIAIPNLWPSAFREFACGKPALVRSPSLLVHKQSRTRSPCSPADESRRHSGRRERQGALCFGRRRPRTHRWRSLAPASNECCGAPRRRGLSLAIAIWLDSALSRPALSARRGCLIYTLLFPRASFCCCPSPTASPLRLTLALASARAHIPQQHLHSSTPMAEAHNQSLRPLSRADSEKTATRSVGDFENKDTSVLPSEAPSVLDATPGPKSSLDKEQATDKVSPENAADDDDDFEYPTKWRLTAITLALCLSVFCMALVRRWCRNRLHGDRD